MVFLICLWGFMIFLCVGLAAACKELKTTADKVWNISFVIFIWGTVVLAYLSRLYELV